MKSLRFMKEMCQKNILRCRVRSAISKKDEQINDLKASYEKCLEQVEYLEGALERQTKERILVRKK